MHPSNSKIDFVSLNIVATMHSLMSILLDHFGTLVLFVAPTAVELSVCEKIGPSRDETVPA